MRNSTADAKTYHDLGATIKRGTGGVTRSIGLALLVFAVRVAAEQGPSGRPPVLTLGVRCQAELRSPAAGPIRVSNLGLIGLEIGTHYFEIPSVQTSPGPLDLILANDEGRPSTERPNLEIEIFKIGPGARVPASARFHSSGVSGGSEYRDKLPGARFVHAISVWLAIPLDEVAQRASVEHFLDELQRAGKLEEARRFDLLRTNRTLREHLVREHQPGQYEVSARFRPRPSDYWQRELRSTSLRLDILSKGRWFDPLVTARRSPTNGDCE
jgi:hypothetical protein